MYYFVSISMRYGLLAALALATTSGSAGAITISYDLTPVTGDVYRYDYTITNDGSLPGEAPVEGFQIEFADASDLSIRSTASITATWDEQIFNATLPDPAAYDALATAGGIANGMSLGGFTVQFTWNGAGLPGNQAFFVYDPQTFQPLPGGAGITEPSRAIPEPATLSLTVMGLLGIIGLRRYTRIH